MIQVNIAVTLFRCPGRNGRGPMVVSSPDPYLRFYYRTWTIDGNHSLFSEAPLRLEVLEGQRYYIEVTRANERGQIALLIGSVNWNGFELEEDDEGCHLTLENEVVRGIYSEGRAWADPSWPCVCCGHLDYPLTSFSRGCSCNLIQRCPACRKCLEHCACPSFVEASTASMNEEKQHHDDDRTRIPLGIGATAPSLRK